MGSISTGRFEVKINLDNPENKAKNHRAVNALRMCPPCTQARRNPGAKRAGLAVGG